MIKLLYVLNLSLLFFLSNLALSYSHFTTINRNYPQSECKYEKFNQCSGIRNARKKLKCLKDLSNRYKYCTEKLTQDFKKAHRELPRQYEQKKKEISEKAFESLLSKAHDSENQEIRLNLYGFNQIQKVLKELEMYRGHIRRKIIDWRIKRRITPLFRKLREQTLTPEELTQLHQEISDTKVSLITNRNDFKNRSLLHTEKTISQEQRNSIELSFHFADEIVEKLTEFQNSLKKVDLTSSSSYKKYLVDRVKACEDIFLWFNKQSEKKTIFSSAFFSDFKSYISLYEKEKIQCDNLCQSQQNQSFCIEGSYLPIGGKIDDLIATIEVTLNTEPWYKDYQKQVINSRESTYIFRLSILERGVRSND